MPNIKQIEAELEGVLAQEAVELVDLRYLRDGGRWVLRLFVDKHGGITLEDCEHLSKRVGAVLDVMDAIPHSYALEVSSPGLDRVLKKEKDFQRFAGHRVRVRLKLPLSGRRRFNGYLRGVEAGRIELENDGGKVHLEISAIEEARLDPDIKI